MLRNVISSGRAGVRRAGVRRAVPAALAVGALAGSWLAAPAASAVTSPVAHHSVAGVIGSPSRLQKPGLRQEKSVLAYWTRARLRAAKPVDVINAGNRPDVQPPAAHPAHPAGRPGSIPGGLPAGRGLAVTRSRPAAGPAGYSYPYPYSSFNVPAADYTKWPYELNGRLFFNNDGGSYSCSGTVVGSHSGTSNENEVWTAGHCLVNTESLTKVVDSSAIFIPAYNGNVADFDPFGEFTWNGGWETSSAWYYNRDLTEDEAAMTFNTSTLNGRTLGQDVGWDGFAWNWPVNENLTAFGYPAGSPYNGASLVEDIAPTAGQDGGIGGADPTKPIVIGNPMTGGSSGGAWNIDWSASGPGYVDGHNDYKYSNQPLAMYSPYQDTLSNDVRCFGASSC